MEPQVVEWLNLTVKWIHLIVGIAWIGASFYFNWLEGNLRRGHPELANGVAGDLWAVHGGGFYHVQKYENTPDKLPETLHWFKWEAYLTGITGFTMMALVFYLFPELSLLKAGSDIGSTMAIVISVGALVVAWLFYDLLCKSPIGKMSKTLFAIMVVFLFGMAELLSLFFTAKAVYLHVGAMIGTIMVANVFFGIMPSQRKMVDAMTAGEVPDPMVGKLGFQRSLHNNYFTLPVLFVMISGHYPMTYGHEHGLWILLAISLIGVLVRHYFNLKNRGQKVVWILPLSALLLALVAYLSFPKTQTATAAHSEVSYQQVQPVVAKHCVVCHSATPTFAGFTSAPLGLILDNESDLQRSAGKVMMQSVNTHAMPPGNLTQMSDKERQLLGDYLLSSK